MLVSPSFQTSFCAFVPVITLYALIVWLAYKIRILTSRNGMLSADIKHPKSRLNLFVMGGPIQRTAVLRVYPSDTVYDVFVALRRRHLVPNSKRIQYNLYFPQRSFAPLQPQEQLVNVGVQDMSTLYLGGRLLGGAGPTSQDSQREPAPQVFAFTNRTGQFPAKDPHLWRPLDGDRAGRFKCLLCPLSQPVLPYRSHISQHENTMNHKRALKRSKRSLHHVNVSGPHDGHSRYRVAFTAVGPADVRGPLAKVLMQMNACNYSTAVRDSHTIPHDDGSSEPPVLHPEVLESSLPSAVNPVTSEQTTFAVPFQPPLVDPVVHQISERLNEFLVAPDTLQDNEERSNGGDRESHWQNPDEHIDFHILERGSTIRHEPEADSDSDSEDSDSTDNPWYPWQNKETCILDILRHIPRCAFSERQNIVIHWAMRALGLNDIPSEKSMQRIDKALQDICGVDSIRFKGALGHIYYANDLAALIAQEMSNPLVRPYLNFLPEDAGDRMSEAWQASRWLRELIPQLGTQMIRTQNQDFFVLEPVLMHDMQAYMPLRWFKRRGRVYAKAYRMEPDPDMDGWQVDGRHEFEICESDLLLSFPHFRQGHVRYGLPNPAEILGMKTLNDVTPWTLTDPRTGNPWRERARGRRVLAFPIWLYCDDTSGNVSKRWNKHNSFLFTAAGLPRCFIHKEYNIHFLSTSNSAPPLEMLDGIVQQLRECQEHGIWAWDSLENEWALLIPSVLALLGDNPMQSELACHIGMMGKLFCRCCWVSSSVTDADDANADPDIDGSDNESIYSEISEASQSPTSGRRGRTGRGKKPKAMETLQHMMERVKMFMAVGQPRTREQTLRFLRAQFNTAKEMAAQTELQRTRMQTGIKDTFLTYFIDKLCYVASARRGRTWVQREQDLAAAVADLPPDETAMLSPVWRIDDLDPHKDTPVEILHVVLLGFVKYLWRDSVARLPQKDNDNSRQILMARLASCNVSGLKLPPLSGHTLVTYAKSLTGRDFRALVQVAPFVLHGLPGISSELLDTWVALGSLVRLIWQPEIHDIANYLDCLQKSIDYFLNCVCILTPRWFNKPKFHILLHLPEHVRRFGPAILFATEGVHSNRQAPSRDIACSMARQNRTRHLLSGGYFPIDLGVHTKSTFNCTDAPPSEPQILRSTWLSKFRMQKSLEGIRVRKAGPSVATLITSGELCSDLLGLNIESILDKTLKRKAGNCEPASYSSSKWEDTEAGKSGLMLRVSDPDDLHFYTAKNLTLADGDICKIKDWVAFQGHNGEVELGQVAEILQQVGSAAQQIGKADWVLVRKANILGTHSILRMPLLSWPNALRIVRAEAVLGLVNVQHNCIEHRCSVKRIRTIVQEREKTDQRSEGISHRFQVSSASASNIQPDWILNMCQMRNSHLLSSFACDTPTLNRDNIIFEAARKEVDRLKQKQHAEEEEFQIRTSRTRRAPVIASQSPTAPILVSNNTNSRVVSSGQSRLANVIASMNRDSDTLGQATTSTHIADGMSVRDSTSAHGIQTTMYPESHLTLAQSPMQSPACRTAGYGPSSNHSLSLLRRSLENSSQHNSRDTNLVSHLPLSRMTAQDSPLPHHHIQADRDSGLESHCSPPDTHSGSQRPPIIQPDRYYENRVSFVNSSK
ncbi:hypothetical protein K474DRAFT_1712363 [Panus rudis PR-1116 ss-1]|nr:hypothetical protein K474DRAFT_1712363 [Panus rudis PR-1116 ss-1]